MDRADAEEADAGKLLTRNTSVSGRQNAQVPQRADGIAAAPRTCAPAHGPRSALAGGIRSRTRLEDLLMKVMRKSTSCSSSRPLRVGVHLALAAKSGGRSVYRSSSGGQYPGLVCSQDNAVMFIIVVS